jgi:hypothetical protein
MGSDLTSRGLNFLKFDERSIFSPTSQKIGIWWWLSPEDDDQRFRYGDMVHLKLLCYGSWFMGELPVAPPPGRPSLYLHCPEDSPPPEQIEGHLPEEGIDDVFCYPGVIYPERSFV